MLRADPFLNYTPSQTSSAAVALAYYTHGSSIWSKKMQETFGYELEELKDIIVFLNGMHFEAETLPQQAIQEKYKGSKFLQASTVKPKKIQADEIDEVIAKFNGGDELNTTAENIECVRQKTEMLLN
jgi:cyclin A